MRPGLLGWRKRPWDEAMREALISYIGYGVKRRVYGERHGRVGGWTYRTERVKNG